jgi:probable phosphoglycerate mutase
VAAIVLVRHGETEWNLERRWQGHADPELNETGRAQALAVARSLGAKPFNALYSSDLVRARETAEIIGKELGLPIQLDPRLREVDVGDWSGLTTPEIEQRYPDGLRRRREGGTGWEHGESYTVMGERVVAALHAIAEAHPGGRVLVVTHGGPMCSTWLAGGGTLFDWPRPSNCDLDEIAVENRQIRRIDSVRSGGLHQQIQG